ncbi:hypothetical protein BUY04_01895 [Staphylococcus chromogenes]|nr:DUF1643 domain-containing protein [Staphylococcus chromogenes]PTF58497.1 hypothetical protein BUY04_01895 [Staphylococcus chromogenes]PTF74656.1 hypothetical protein BUY02_11235 [Staphylococcus chromogenes]PTF89491.1 hypothetical protein BU685_09715 [Staphylococcus chromogenes]PUZ08824.1 DUF1643 domain-containing protein [Staphylococcus chromogenes]
MEIIELPIEFEFNGQTNWIYPSLIVLNNELTLVDTGYTNFLPLIENEIVKNGYEIKNLKNIIITHYDGVTSLDLTTVLVLNALSSNAKLGAIYFVNLFSNISSSENIKHIQSPYDKHTDIHLMKSISEADEIILAYGAYAKRPVVEQRVQTILEMLKPHKKKVKKLINPETNEIMHPLNPKARQKWHLKPF